MKSARSLLPIVIFAVLTPFSFAETDAALVPSLVQRPTRTDVCFDVSGGWPELSVDVFPTIGWAIKRLGQPYFSDISMKVLPGTPPGAPPGGPLDYVAQVCATFTVKPYSCSLTSPVSPVEGVLRDCTGWTLSEFTTPDCDDSGSDYGFFTVRLKGGATKQLGPVRYSQSNYNLIRLKQKAWLCSNFRLSISGADCSRVNKVDPMTVRVAVADLNGDGLPDMALQGSNLSFTMPLDDSAPFLLDLATGGGQGVPPHTGRLDFLDDTGKVMEYVFLTGIRTLSTSPSFNARNSGHATEKIEVSWETMELKST